MDFQAYLGIGVIVVGLAMAAREVMRRKHADALRSVVLSLMGALLLTTSVMEGGWASRAVLVGRIVVGVATGLAASRLSERQGG